MAQSTNIEAQAPAQTNTTAESFRPGQVLWPFGRFSTAWWVLSMTQGWRFLTSFGTNVPNLAKQTGRLADAVAEDIVRELPSPQRSFYDEYLNRQRAWRR